MKYKNVYVTVIVATLIAIGVYMNFGLGQSPDDACNFILTHINAKGEIVDFGNDLKVTGIDSISYYWEPETNYVEIHFGVVDIKMKEEDLTRKALVNKLSQIGLKMSRHKKTNELLIKYNGELLRKVTK